MNCHIAVPHGWKRPRLIVNSGPGAFYPDNSHVATADPAPYRSSNQFGTSDAVGAAQGGPWWGMEAFPSEKPNPLQPFANLAQPLPPDDRVDDHNPSRVGMQSISGTDEHELILSAPGNGERGPFTGMNDNFIEWTEFKCGACDFHHPYTEGPGFSLPAPDTIRVVE